MRDTSKFRREKIGVWKPERSTSSQGTTLRLSLSQSVKSMCANTNLLLGVKKLNKIERD